MFLEPPIDLQFASSPTTTRPDVAQTSFELSPGEINSSTGVIGKVDSAAVVSAVASPATSVEPSSTISTASTSENAVSVAPNSSSLVISNQIASLTNTTTQEPAKHLAKATSGPTKPSTTSGPTDSASNKEKSVPVAIAATVTTGFCGIQGCDKIGPKNCPLCYKSGHIFWICSQAHFNQHW